MAADSDDESSASEILPKKPNKLEAQVQDDEDNSEDMDEDEYVVEAITAHRFMKKGALEFKVKWQGFSEKDSTWEPEENLEGAPDELQTYYKEIGGKPQPNKGSSKPDPPAKKRKLSYNGTSENKTPSTGSAKKDARQRDPTSKKELLLSDEYPKGSWEDDVLNIDTMTRDGDKIKVWVVWKKTGTKTVHDTPVVYHKCPQKCLQFYESHLQFNTTTPSKPRPQETLVERSNVTEKKDSPGIIDSTAKGEDESSQDEEDFGVKKVASAV